MAELCTLFVVFIQVVEELKRLVAYVEREIGEKSQLTGLALSSRKNLCINDQASDLLKVFTLLPNKSTEGHELGLK